MLIERRVGGRTLRADCQQRNQVTAAAAIAAFEPLAADADLADGALVRFGFSMLRLELDGDALRLTEPVFEAWPHARWSPTIDITLDVTAFQVRLLAAVDAEGEDAWFDQLLLSAPGALDESENFLRRIGSVDECDSGWLLGTLRDPEALTAADALEPVEIARLVSRHRTLLGALALPRGWVAIVMGNEIREVYDPGGNERLAGKLRA
jgi:hypothetical protein